ncbi:MAG: efflux RND transporter periplasmic adaptor subunit [Bacteroidales bacterium]|nr:efflux RND transporter periplasmic adaptor subunit [Bacteroidales bacterium]
MMKTIIPHSLALVLLFVACNGGQDAEIAVPSAVESAPSAAKPSWAKAPDTTLTLMGTIVADPSRTERIVAPVDGRVEGLAARVGDDVSAGTLIARLLGRESAERNIQRRQVESEYYLADRDMKLKSSLYNDGLVSECELTEAMERREVALTALTQQAVVATGDIKASRNGTVLRRDVTNGQYVQAGELLLEVSDISTVQVLADVYESDISRVHVGDSVTVTTLAHPSAPLRAAIDKVYSALDPDSKTMKVRITLRNSDRHLLPGMFATITVEP